jgi:hypothetical protein
MEVYSGLEVQFHSFLTSALDGGEWSVSHPGLFTPGKGLPVPTGWASQSVRTVLKNVLGPCKESTHGYSLVQSLLYISTVGLIRCAICFSLRLIACTRFEHFFAHHQEVLHVQQLVYRVCIVLAATYTINTVAVHTAPPDDEQRSARNM